MTSVLFIHHSIGRQIIGGGLRAELQSGSESLVLWDHDYNEIGLTDPAGNRVGRSFPIPDDDTDPRGLLTVLEGLAGAATWDVPEHDVLVAKSCFPNNSLRSDGQVAELRKTYEAMRSAALELPQTVLLLSSPPLVVESTGGTERRRAEEVARWLDTRWCGPGLAYGNLFAALSYRSGPFTGALRTAYRARRPRDSHLSAAGSRIGARFVAEAIRRVRAVPAA